MTHNIVLDSRRIIVFANIKGLKEPKSIKLILDTGASISVLDEGAVALLGFDVKKLDKGDRLATAGGNINSKIIRLPRFSLFGKEVINFEMNVLSLPTQISYFADGLIGMDFLLEFESIKFDFDKKEVEVN